MNRIWPAALAALMLAAVPSAQLRAQEGAAPSPAGLPRAAGIQMEAIPGYGPAPLVVGFLVSSSDPSAAFESFRWEFGDGQVSTLPPMALFHTYARPGSYVVMVTATTTDGRTATAFGGVIVTPPAQ